MEMHALRSVVFVALLLPACGTERPADTQTAPREVTLRLDGLTARVTREGVHVGGAGFSSRFATRALGRTELRKATALEVHDGARAVIDRAGLREWWTSNGKQLEFGYDIEERPSGDGPLQVVLGTEGDGTFRVSSEGVVAFLDGPQGSSASPLAELLDLRARDALGRDLPARFALAGRDLTIVVDDAGARYPIVIDPIVATGIETKLSVTGTVAPKFGTTIAVSPDGNHVMAKDYNDNSVAFYAFAGGSWSSAGSVKFPTASGGTEDFGAFGDALAFAGDNTPLITDYRFNYSGMTWAGGVFTYDATPAYVSTIKQTGAKGDDQFGFSMAASGDSILVGARSTSGGAGNAYIFTHTSGTAFPQQGKLTQPAGTNYYGWTSAIQGDIAMVGCLSRQVFAYRRTGTTWGGAKELKPTEAIVSADNFGISNAVGGKVLLSAAWDKKITAASDGQVYVFTDTGSAFVEEGPMFAAPPTGAAGGKLGSSLAITPDGNTAFVGAPAAAGQGRVYVLTHAGTTWTLVRTLVPSDPTTLNFGAKLALAGDRLVVGAPSDPATTPGFVYIYGPALGLAPAAKCTGAIDCASGFCVDGVCCDTACTGSCEACNVAGKEGTCSPVKGTPVAPRAACPATGTGECASTCDGVTRATCTLGSDSTPCGLASCDAMGRAIGVGHCDGAGSCTFPTPASCAPYVCADGLCKTSCKLDTECAEGSRCTEGKCVMATFDLGPKVNLGAVQPCKADSDCATGHCSEGVCCDQACKDKCSSCVVPGFIGRCVAESGIDMRGDCMAASCSTVCQAGECRSVRAGDQCAPSLCVDINTAQGPSTCSAVGSACTPNTGTLNCAPYVCALGACLTSCVDSSQCVSGTVCDTASQRCIAATEESSGGCAIGEPKRSVVTYAWLLGALASIGAVRRKRR